MIKRKEITYICTNNNNKWSIVWVWFCAYVTERKKKQTVWCQSRKIPKVEPIALIFLLFLCLLCRFVFCCKNCSLMFCLRGELLLLWLSLFAIYLPVTERIKRCQCFYDHFDWHPQATWHLTHLSEYDFNSCLATHNYTTKDQ